MPGGFLLANYENYKLTRPTWMVFTLSLPQVWVWSLLITLALLFGNYGCWAQVWQLGRKRISKGTIRTGNPTPCVYGISVLLAQKAQIDSGYSRENGEAGLWEGLQSPVLLGCPRAMSSRFCCLALALAFCGMQMPLAETPDPTRVF